MHTRSSSQSAGGVVWCVTTAHRVIMSGCSTMLILLGCGRGGTARCLTGSVIIALQRNRILVAPTMTQVRDVKSLVFYYNLNNV